MDAYTRLCVVRTVGALVLAVHYAMQANTGTAIFCLAMAALFAWDTRTPYTTY